MRKPVTGIIVLLTLQFAVPTLCSAGAFGPFLYNQLHVFTNSPDGSQPLSLLPGPDNALYGVTYAGGSSAGGTIYRINRDGSGYAILANFSTSQTGNSNSPEYEIADGSLGSGIPGFDASSALYYYPLLGGLTVAL